MLPLVSRVLILVVCAFYGVNSLEYVPVFMWGATAGSPHNTRGLSKLDAAHFKDVLTEQLDAKPFTVVFIEETLSVEDFSSKDQAGRSSYPGLREKMTGDSVIYYPFVASALHTLNRLADPKKIDRVQLTEDGLSADITPGAGQFLYITLKDAREGEDRLHMLARHDQFMTEMFDKLLKKHDSVLGIYTARQPSWAVPPERTHKEGSGRSRVGRSLLNVNWTSEANAENGFYNISGGLNVFLFASKITLKDTKDANYSVELKGGTTRMLPNETQWEYNVWLDFAQANIRFTYIVGNDSYWTMGATLLPAGGSEIAMDTQITAASDFSFHCSPSLKFTPVNDTKYFVIEDFQTEIFLRSLSNSKFDLAYDCVGFTTVPIWSGLFIAFLMLFITSIGVSMMMDIRTMDRFDDPKGKTITITTTE